jgi:quinol monooxygenase YgiN
MPASVHVVARFVPRQGKEDAVKAVLSAAMVLSRRELGCYQYDLLVSATEPREYCVIERWEGNASLDAHLETEHARRMLSDLETLVETPPDIRRYRSA